MLTKLQQLGIGCRTSTRTLGLDPAQDLVGLLLGLGHDPGCPFSRGLGLALHVVPDALGEVVRHPLRLGKDVVGLCGRHPAGLAGLR
jgi:hypothetical protein